MITKILKKASHFWKHGKYITAVFTAITEKKKEKTFNSVKELMSYRRKRI